jgi:hypothetical protein
LSRPTGVTTAAVPQAKTSVISPDSTPVRHSSMSTRRSSTVEALLLGQLEDRGPRDALEDRAGELGGDERAVGVDEEEVHPAELLDPASLDGVEEDHLVAAVLDRLELLRPRATPRSCRRTWPHRCRPGRPRVLVDSQIETGFTPPEK